MKSLKLRANLPILILVSILTCYLVLKDSLDDISEILSNCNLLILIVAIGILFLSDVFKALSIYNIAIKSEAKISLKESFYLTLETNFFNGVTPFALGGQPFQLYLLKKRNKIDYIKGTNILFCDYYIYQITLMLFVILLYVLNLIFDFITLNSVMRSFLFIGFSIHFGIFLFLIYVTYGKEKDSKIVCTIIHLLSKMKIIKDEETTKTNILSKIHKFRELIKNFRKDYKLIFKTMLFNLLKLALYGVIPYLCFKSIGISNISVMASITTGVFVWTIASFIPIPGATGGMEYSFIALLTSILPEITVKSGVIIWRFLTYYLFICIGAWIFFITNNNKKKSKLD